MRRDSEYRIGVGASSILMILVVLALAGLSLLSLHAARDNAVLTRRNLSMTVAYYEAAAQVQRTLAVMDAARGTLTLTDANDRAAYRKALINCELPVALEDDLTFAMAADAGAQREIAVQGKIPATVGNPITLTEHVLRNTAETLQDEPLSLMMP